MAGKFEELWVRKEDGRSLSALINGERGWLMYLRDEEGDPGFSSRNPAYAGDPAAVIEYELSNGQRDEYPAAWAYPVFVVRRALAYFEAHGRPPPFIQWHNDSADGETIPYEPAA